MKLFSLESVSRKAGRTFGRFPLSILAAMAASVVMVRAVHYYEHFAQPEPYHLYKLAMSCFLVMLLSISVSLYAERFTFSAVKKNIAYVIVIALGVFYFYTLPPELDPVSILRFILFAIALHLLVAFVAFMVRSEVNGLWQFNKYLFLRAVITAIYGGVLCLGLFLALRAIDKLFGVDIDDKYYFDLFIVISGIFCTWFFLAGFPENLPALEDETSYPNGLKIFTVYILLPLVTIYVAILYVYAAKILITAQWPVGWVAYLVIAFAVFGILSFLLIYPLRSDESQKWVTTYSRLFYFLLLPLIALLFVAIFKRINMYGVTEDRYFVVLLACWLTFISLYLIVTGGKNIPTIPVSLCLIALLSSFGPWGAFSISRNSQMKELTELLDSNHVLKSGMVDTSNTHNVTAEDYSRIRDVVRYLNMVHSYKSLQPLFAQNLDSLFSEDHRGRSSRWYLYTDKIVDLMKLNKILSANDSIYALSRYFNKREDEMLNAKGYDLVTDFKFNGYYADAKKFALRGDTMKLAYSDTARRFTLTYKDFEPLVLEAGIVMDSIYAAANSESRSLPDSIHLYDFIVESDSRDWKAKIIFTELNLQKQSGKAVPNYGSGMLFVKLNKENVDRENEVGEKKE